jgi:lipoprotein-anchoring transpeptidase ErfK/SrfK
LTPISRSSLKLTATLALGAITLLAGTAPAGASHRRVAHPTQRLVIMEQTHRVYSRPDRHSHRLPAVNERRPITGERTVLPVLGTATGKRDGRRWLHVLLPGRPNGHTGWILPWATRDDSTMWRISVSTSRRLVTVYRYGRVVNRFRAVVGKPSTPTPHGHFFVEETVRLRSGLVGSPYALALSARSNVLQQFDGGPGQIALHGLGGVGGTPGTAVSHGCIRLSHGPISWLAARIGPGVRVTITG